LHSTSDANLALEETLAAAKETQESYNTKRWTYTFAGRTVVLKEEADKVVGWLNRFTAIGDVVANVDPVHIGLPWAGIRLLFQMKAHASAAVSEANQMTSLLVGCEIALYMANRLRAYTDFFHRLPITLTRTNLETAVTELYAHVFRFLARAIRIYQTSTTHRALHAFGTDNDVAGFEKVCNELGVRVDIEASNCDRTLSTQDRERVGNLKQDLQEVLEELRKSHRFQESLDRLETKIDLDKLPGWAGIGKSTISRTVAKWVASQGGLGSIDLGASFFFKRGEGDRGSASRFFPTITRELVLKVPRLDTFVAERITQDPLIFDKALGEQFDKLIYEPLCQVALTTVGSPTFIVVVDALDECEKEKDVKAIIDLWSRLAHLTTVRLKLFLTSRPELPIQLGFDEISAAIHQDMVLQDAVPHATIQQDISTFLKAEFGEIRNRYSLKPLSETSLDRDWPGDKRLKSLVEMAVPLFIIAATVCRFVGDSDWDPRERLETILQFRSIGESEQMAQIYLPVLKKLSAGLKNSHDKDKLHQEFRMIVGSIISLAEPLSIQSLAVLLNIYPGMITLRLRPLHSVLRIPPDSDTPIRTLHLSFNEFLLSDQLQLESFGVDSQATHRMLLLKCLQLLSGHGGLQENLCKLEYPGKLRREIDQVTINDRLTSAFQYACRYWIQHVERGKVEILDQDDVHVFLQEHFLHWLEAMSLMNRLAEVIEQIRVLQSLVAECLRASSIMDTDISNHSTNVESRATEARGTYCWGPCSGVLARRLVARFSII
ncbi:MAG: hypothetical protein Q9212_002981, partial [Teloschistes hypoglaucus]